jgi:hypothetical protein
MTNFIVTIYDSPEDLKAAVEALPNTTTIYVVPFMQREKQKFMLIR